MKGFAELMKLIDAGFTKEEILQAVQKLEGAHSEPAPEPAPEPLKADSGWKEAFEAFTREINGKMDIMTAAIQKSNIGVAGPAPRPVDSVDDILMNLIDGGTRKEEK